MVKALGALLALGAVIVGALMGLSWLEDKYDEWMARPRPPAPSAQPYHPSYEEWQEDQAYQYEQQEESSSDGEGWGGESELRGGDEFEDRCSYDPTMNYDWHDDWVCDGERLYLLPNDEFVDEQELEQAARESIR